MNLESTQLTETQFVARERRLAAESGGRLLEYGELAEMLGIGIRTARDWKAAGWITPIKDYGNVTRFHWPSVVDQLRRRDEGLKRKGARR